MIMAKVKVELKVSPYSSIPKFIDWYKQAYATKSPTGRVMSGKSNDFLIKVLQSLCDGKFSATDKEVFTDFVASKDKTDDEILAEKIYANDPDKLKTFQQFQKELAKHRKK
tara:strand:+ start:182 stop:514 length:333 start_codon:yes stop_codon:yes gene_type:complete